MVGRREVGEGGGGERMEAASPLNPPFVLSVFQN